MLLHGLLYRLKGRAVSLRVAPLPGFPHPEFGELFVKVTAFHSAKIRKEFSRCALPALQASKPLLDAFSSRHFLPPFRICAPFERKIVLTSPSEGRCLFSSVLFFHRSTASNFGAFFSHSTVHSLTPEQSPTMSTGYWQDAAASKAAFTADGYFRTGDMVQCSPTGAYRVLDRVGSLIALDGGFRYVSPSAGSMSFVQLCVLCVCVCAVCACNVCVCMWWHLIDAPHSGATASVAAAVRVRLRVVASPAGGSRAGFPGHCAPRGRSHPGTMQRLCALH